MRCSRLAAVSQSGLHMATVNAAPAQVSKARGYEAPAVFQAAGPDSASIQGAVDAYRLGLGEVSDGNAQGRFQAVGREINWDGGGSTATAIAATPFAGFLNTRGALFVTPGSGFVQAPSAGLADTFANPAYATIFAPFTPCGSSARSAAISRMWSFSCRAAPAGCLPPPADSARS